MKKKLILTGGSGLLAMNWAAYMRDKYDIILIMHKRIVNLQGVISYKVDIGSVEELTAFFLKIKPNVVIHTAGLTSVETCEKNPSLAYKINVELAANVAIASHGLGIRMIHISTDHLFSGNQKLVIEEESLSPCNIYGITKGEAEKKVIALAPNSLIIRTNFYGWGTSYRKSFSDTIIETLRDQRTIKLFDNVFYTPIITDKLVKLTHDLLEVNAKGIYNIVSDKRVSKYEFGMSVAEVFDLDKSLIIKSYLNEELNLVKRPLDMSLSNHKVSSLLNMVIGDIHDHIKLLKLKEDNPEIIEIKMI
jgi:dTDP-4-dehydrorhamnose reductase